MSECIASRSPVEAPAPSPTGPVDPRNDAHKKYKGYQFETVGHSQGALLAHLLSDRSKNGYLFNPAYKKNN